MSSDAALQINNGVTLSIDAGASMTVGTSSVVYQDTNNNVGGGIAVSGSLTATGTNFVKGGGGVTAGITVQPAGHLTATGADFAWDGLTLYGGSVLNSGDLAKDSFNLTIAVPITDIPLLAGNVVFQTVEIDSANLASGTINLTPTLSSSPSPQLVYDFISAFEIKAGAALTVASDAAVQLNNGVTISVDPGATMTVGAASVVYQDTNNNVGGGIAVGGTLAATGTNFVKGGGGVTAGITVQPAGHLTATGADFAWDGLTLYGGSVLNSGDLAKDSFNLTIAVPITDIPLLAGNVVFQTVEIDSANLASGTINLTPTLSSSPSPQLVYDFISAFEIKAGAALTVASDAAVQLNNGVTISVDPGATMTVGAASVVYQDTNNNVGGGIAVGGTLAATGTNFVKGGGGVTAGITVQPAGHLTATGADFAWDGLTLYGGSVLNSGDLAKDSFNLTIAVPITDIPLLAGNVVFQTVEIDSANLASGTINLTPTLSSSPSPQLVYDFISAFEIKAGAALTVASDAAVQLNNGVTISVDPGATMTVGAASVVYQDTNNNVGGGIAVGGHARRHRHQLRQGRRRRYRRHHGPARRTPHRHRHRLRLGRPHPLRRQRPEQRRPGQGLVQLDHRRPDHRHPAAGRQRRVPDRRDRLRQPRQRGCRAH